MNNSKIVNAQRAKDIHHYKTIKQKVNKTIASIWCSKICRTYPHTPKTTNHFI